MLACRMSVQSNRSVAIYLKQFSGDKCFRYSIKYFLILEVLQVFFNKRAQAPDVIYLNVYTLYLIIHKVHIGAILGLFKTAI